MGLIAPERERTVSPPPPPRPASPPPPPPRRRRPLPWGLFALVGIIVVLVAGRDWVGGLLPGLPSIPNPFAAETVDRSQPAVLQAVQDLQQFRAASGHYEVIVDLEHDTRLPAALLGERILFVAVGSADASVDFSGLAGDAVQVSEDRRSATIVLPRPAIGDARLDVSSSYVYDRRRGVLNVFAGPSTLERDVYAAAQGKLDEAARASDDLARRAEANTRAMLQTLLRSLGFEQVTVRFE